MSKYLVLASLVINVILAVVLTALLSQGNNQPSKPYCPTEDSCTVDYRDGEWVVSEVTP